MWSSHWNWPNDRWIQVPQNTWQTIKKPIYIPFDEQEPFAYDECFLLEPDILKDSNTVVCVIQSRSCYTNHKLMRKHFIRQVWCHRAIFPELITMVTKIFKRLSNSGKANINGRRVINQRYWLRSTGISWISFTRGKLLLKLAENKIDERRSLHAMFTGVFPQTICKNIQFFLIKPKPQTWRLNELWKQKIIFYLMGARLVQLVLSLIEIWAFSTFLSTHSAEQQNELES